MTVVIGWAPILVPWSDRLIRSIEPRVPPRQFADAMRFRRWQDRQARLLSRLILLEILRRQRVGRSLGDIEVTDAGRPFIRGGGDFNIAHTASVALCSWVPRGRIGIDVEESRPTLTIEDMWPWMSDAERRRIETSPAPLDEALRLWTAKEAVCKADGCGIAVGELPNCATAHVAFRGQVWRVRSRRRRGHAVSFAREVQEPCDWRAFRLPIDERTIASLTY